jgi:hypothetical protein
MRLLLLPFFLTFVLYTPPTFAAPQTTTTIESTPLTGDDDPSLKRVAPELRDQEITSYFNLSAGFAGGNFLERDEYEQGPFVALRYMPLLHDQIVWDYHLAINFSKESLIELALGRRWYCCPGDEFMPYARASANLILNPKDELAGVAEIRRWRLRAAVGIGESFVWEFGVGLAVTGPDIYAQFGYNFGF